MSNQPQQRSATLTELPDWSWYLLKGYYAVTGYVLLPKQSAPRLVIITRTRSQAKGTDLKSFQKWFGGSISEFLDSKGNVQYRWTLSRENDMAYVINRLLEQDLPMKKRKRLEAAQTRLTERRDERRINI